MTPARFPHSDTPGSTLGCQLPRAYRRLLRPSSALDAKASTMCPSQLVTHTTNPTPPTNKTCTTGKTCSTEKEVGPDWRCTLIHDTPQKNRTPPPQSDEGMHIKTKRNTPLPHPSTNQGAAGASPDARVHYPDLKQQPHTHQHALVSSTAGGPGSCTRHPVTRAPKVLKPQTPPPPVRGGGGSDSSEPQQCVADELQPSRGRSRGRGCSGFSTCLIQHQLPPHGPGTRSAHGWWWTGLLCSLERR
jgi:hypothetical protein